MLCWRLSSGQIWNPCNSAKYRCAIQILIFISGCQHLPSDWEEWSAPWFPVQIVSQNYYSCANSSTKLLFYIKYFFHLLTVIPSRRTCCHVWKAWEWTLQNRWNFWIILTVICSTPTKYLPNSKDICFINFKMFKILNV